MRTKLLKVGVLTAACMVLAAGSAGASILEVKVPFPFVVQGKTMPAGQYQVTDEDGLLRLRGEKGTHAVDTVLTIPASGSDPAGKHPVLMFKRHENQYRLTGVWESETEGREINR